MQCFVLIISCLCYVKVMSTIISNPIDLDQITLRNQFLQSTLRSDEQDKVAIESEYPLVLAPEYRNRSYLLLQDQQIIAHCNTLERLVVSETQTSFAVGLVGNVATSPHFRGQGHMRTLLAHMNEVAANHHWSALILWSDLLTFYQNLGFAALGKERRWHVSRKLLRDRSKQLKNQGLEFAAGGNISLEQAEKLMKCRAQCPCTLARTPLEMLTLLKIPQTHLFQAHDPGTSEFAFLIMGRGSDMKGIVHEWGGNSGRALTLLLLRLIEVLQMESIMVLAPEALDQRNYEILKKLSKSHEKHPSALVRFTDSATSEQKEAIANMFVWGLDSI